MVRITRDEAAEMLHQIDGVFRVAFVKKNGATREILCRKNKTDGGKAVTVKTADGFKTIITDKVLKIEWEGATYATQ